MKLGIEFYWYRKFQDGRVEFEFDQDLGTPLEWGVETPGNIVEAGWLPMTIELAKKIAAFGETGIPLNSPLISLKLKAGESPEIFRDRTIVYGAVIKCKCCGQVFRSAEPPQRCPTCGISPDDSTDANPFQLTQSVWQEAIYVLGIKDRFKMQFNRVGLIAEQIS